MIYYPAVNSGKGYEPIRKDVVYAPLYQDDHNPNKVYLSKIYLPISAIHNSHSRNMYH